MQFIKLNLFPAKFVPKNAEGSGENELKETSIMRLILDNYPNKGKCARVQGLRQLSRVDRNVQ